MKRAVCVQMLVRLGLVIALVLGFAVQLIAVPLCSADEDALSIELRGWGWCLAYRDIGNVSANLTGTAIPRAESPEISDIYLTGTLHFNLPERTDSFELELRGTKVRSLFFLKQVTGGGNPLIAGFEGTWLDETGYVACQGRLAVPVADHVARPYVVVLRTPDSAIPVREGGTWVQNLEFIVAKSAHAFDQFADRIAGYGNHFKELLGTVLTEIAVLFREIRGRGTPYVL